ncbi:MAG: hypothetical protein HY852_27280 [Bradyrhizobium sp.]|uniref:hypothetical protein n=1 Tax=Bradyrhizobium sp. TaxID=376 RepID=UPI0025C4FC17|nr:hypothetical protein [Bradyrhizobium sp.]MBI5265514.1 hypothetical protein [Bradyrhizobium sp.]
MRKFLVVIIALATLSFLAGVASAGTIQIPGTHSTSEIKSACDKAGGFYSEYGDLYTCGKNCGNDFCRVSCIGGKCLGTCPKCGERRFSVYGGRGAVGSIVTNMVQRPQARNLPVIRRASPWVSSCIVNCIRRAGGTDPVVILNTCMGLCERTGGIVVF